MEPNRLSLDSLTVQSFIVEPAPVSTTRPRVEPAGYETDADHLSICIVSCAGTCGANCPGY